MSNASSKNSSNKTELKPKKKFELSKEFKEKYFNFIYKNFNLEKKIKLLPVDFSKPWYQVLLDQKWNLTLQLFWQVIQTIFSALTPLILGLSILNKRFDYLVYFILVFVLLEVFNRLTMIKLAQLILQSVYSISLLAYNFFLTVDPIFHTSRSSGQIISKIEKTTTELEQLITFLLEGVLSTIISFITVVATLAYFDYRLGIIGTTSFILLAFTNGVLNYINASVFKSKRIKIDDKAKSEAVETLQQNAFIRSAFASNEQIEKVKKSYLEAMNIRAITQQTFGVTRTFTRVIYAISTLTIGYVIFQLINTEQIEIGVGLSLLLVYVSGSSSVLTIGNIIRNSIEMVSRQEDLFIFIRQFGVQTYPVLKSDILDQKFQEKLAQLKAKQDEYLEETI